MEGLQGEILKIKEKKRGEGLMGKSYLKKISLERQYETKYCYSRSNVHVVISVVGHEESCEVWEPSREMEHPP